MNRILHVGDLTIGPNDLAYISVGENWLPYTRNAYIGHVRVEIPHPTPIIIGARDGEVYRTAKEADDLEIAVFINNGCKPLRARSREQVGA